MWPSGFAGRLIVHVSPGGLGTIVRFYRLYPEDMEFWLAYTHGDEWLARTLQQHWVQRNRDMWYMVNERGYPPEYAEAELDYIDEQVFKALVESFAGVLAAGSAISSVGAGMRQAETIGSRLRPGEKMAELEERYAGKLAQSEEEAAGRTAQTGPGPTAPTPTPAPAPAPASTPTPTPTPTPPSLRERASSWWDSLWAKPKTTYDPNMPANIKGRADWEGNIRMNPNQDAASLYKYYQHELVHRWLTPKFLPVLRKFRISVAKGAYENSAFMKYLEEALAQSYAELRTVGPKGLKAGFSFPVANGYVTLTEVILEGAIGVVAYGSIVFSVYFYESQPDEPEPAVP
jgi:hypothetical protein